jgi:hypothetical protein
MTDEGFELMPYAQLWGTEETYNAVSENDIEKFKKLHNEDPQIVESSYPWQFWEVR